MYVVLSALMPPVLTQAQDATCAFYSDITFTKYMKFPNTNFLTGSFMVYSDNRCTEEVDTLDAAPLGYIRSQTQAAAAQQCSAIHDDALMAFRDFPRYNSQEIWYCSYPIKPRKSDDDGFQDSDSGTKFGGAPSSEGDTTKSSTALHTCEMLVRETGLLISAVYGLRSGIQCRRVDAAGVGNQSVIDLGVLDAVDVWGNIGLGYELCFLQLGRIILLDAATSPRSLIDINYGIRDGFTCASMDRAGTVVLVSAPVTAAPLPTVAAAAPAVQRRPGTNDFVRSAIPLDNCKATATTRLRIRHKPWGNQIGVLPEDLAVRAIVRTRSWFYIMFQDLKGWIAAWLTTSEGDCYGSGPGHDALPMSAHGGYQAPRLTGA